jgi:hypothetical protein
LRGFFLFGLALGAAGLGVAFMTLLAVPVAGCFDGLLIGKLNTVVGGPRGFGAAIGALCHLHPAQLNNTCFMRIWVTLRRFLTNAEDIDVAYFILWNRRLTNEGFRRMFGRRRKWRIPRQPSHLLCLKRRPFLDKKVSRFSAAYIK